MTTVNDTAQVPMDLTEPRARSFASGMVGLAVVGVALVSALMTFLVLEGLTSGTWYFVIRAVASDGAESALSDVVSKRIG